MRLHYLYIIPLIILLSCQSESVIIIDEVVPERTKSHASVKAGTAQLPIFSGKHQPHHRYILSGINGSVALSYNHETGALNIPSSINTMAGVYTLTVIGDNNIISNSTLTITAAEATGKALSYLGPKTVPHNDQEGVMMTSAFFDHFNNMTRGQLNVKYFQNSDNQFATISETTDNEYFTYQKLYVGNRDESLVGLSADSIYSDELSFKGSSGCPASATIRIGDYYQIADGTHTFDVIINNIKDEDDEDVEMGTILQAALYDSAHRTAAIYQVMVINGSAKFAMENPQGAGAYHIVISACGTILSDSELLYFSREFTEIPSKWISNSILKIGPVISVLNQKVQNGTLVEFIYNGCPQAEKKSYILEEGICLIDTDDIISECKSNHITITINGISSIIDITE